MGSGNVSAQVNNPFPSIAGAAVFACSNYYYVQVRYKKDLLKLEPIIHFISYILHVRLPWKGGRGEGGSLFLVPPALSQTTLPFSIIRSGFPTVIADGKKVGEE